ncbi:MAG: plasmid mobilization protein, partial [Janthinobacterium lividum]
MTEPTTSRPPRRQVRRAGSRREVTHKVKVSAEQEARLVERADARGITVARLLAESALAGGADAAAATSQLGGELFRISRLLGRVSLNINQLAKVANATGSVPPETG